jgi:hypothetical protein
MMCKASTARRSSNRALVGRTTASRLAFLELLALLAAFMMPASAVFAQQTTKRLILKDGSYQIVTKWEIKGDRVRYYSAERAEWEEVPNSMVDWDATNQYEKDRAAGKMSPAAQALDKELEAERQEEELRSPHVAPGLRLPTEGGVYALDTYLTQPELVPLDQSSGEVNRHVGRNVLRAAINPVAGAKHTVELAGPRSKIQMHASLPTIYINLEPVDPESESSKKSEAELSWDRFRIVRAQVKGDKRIVGAIKTGLTGKISQEQDAIPATAEQLSGDWIKLTPKAPLDPGEYAVVEMLGKEGMNSYVWDFGVHPDAPANLAVIRPDPSEIKKTADQPEGLKKRE